MKETWGLGTYGLSPSSSAPALKPVARKPVSPYFTNSISRYVGSGQVSCGTISSS